MVNTFYEYQGLTVIKITDSLEHLGSHTSLEIPKGYPFANETGMFSVVGQEGIFFISEGMIKSGVKVKSDHKPNREFILKFNKDVLDRKMQALNALRNSEGYGPILKLVGFNVRKVSDVIPYIGYLQAYPITDELYQKHEWLYDPAIVNKRATGVYRIMNSSEIFFIESDMITVRGEEEQHPLLDALQKRFPLPRNYYDDMDEGPFGGAFASNEDYLRYRDSVLFR